MHHIFEAEQWLPYPIEYVFGFFSNPENLPRLMPAWQKARIEEASFAPPPPRPEGTPRLPGVAAGAGTRMTISFRPFPFCPVRLPWEAEITEFAWNDHFCDIQHRGPFAYWKHCHRLSSVEKDGKAGTRVHDHVEYEMHLGLLGELANKLVVPGQFKGIFDYRHKRTEELMAMMFGQTGTR
jgi:ligand-binding SRPBCC domain-containing protein